MPALSVVLPVYNEQARVVAGLTGYARLRDLLGGDTEAVLVDDGSVDGTVARAEALGLPDLTILREPHRGKGGAIRAGVAAARGRRLLLADIDWSVAPERVVDLLAVDAELVCAVREGPAARRLGEPPWRHLLGRAFNRLVQEFLLAGHVDTQCGFKVVDAEAARSLFPRLTVEGWAYDVELITLAHLDGHRVVDVPVTWRFEPDSRVRPLPDGLAMATDVWRIYGNVRRGAYSRGTSR